MPGFKTVKIPKQEQKNISHDNGGSTPPENISKISSPKKKIFSGRVLLLLLLAVTSIFFLSKVGISAFRGNEKNGSENVDLPSIIEEFTTQKVAGTVNILIAGIGGKGHDGSDLTDSIILASLDGKRNEITLLSLPRDLYVAYPEKLGAGRINSLYDLGKRNDVGIQYLASKVSEITGQTIDHYIVIDFAGFKKVIDLLGGIALEVPEDLTDREYPDDNWGYEVFSVKKGPQIFNGETALKYARSRHSTSDFDRSERQQLIVKAIKEKAADLGIIKDINKLGDIYNALISNIDTDMSLAKLGEIALTFSDVKSENIGIVTISDVCLSMTKCQPGSFLYAPSRDLFGGSAVIIPENAHVQKLSYYVDIRRFVDLTFRFPTLRNESRDIVLIYDPSQKRRAQEIGIGLAKLGFPISFEKSMTASTGTIEKSHINYYWYESLQVGINPESPTILGLQYIEPGIPLTQVEKNEYINTTGPRIEIVIGKDALEYFREIKSPYYMPTPPKTTSGESSGSAATGGKTPSRSPSKELPKKESVSGEMFGTIGDGWENF